MKQGWTLSRVDCAHAALEKRASDPLSLHIFKKTSYRHTTESRKSL